MTDNTQTNWQQELIEIRLPRWNELPDIELYMEQLIQLVERYTAPFKVSETEKKLITSSMVHNYVKKEYILPPEKKKYDQRHLARLIIITILKQSFDLPMIQKGIKSQMNQGDYKLAYDHFCQQLEDSIAALSQNIKKNQIVIDISSKQYSAVQMATIALAAKLVTEKNF